MLFIASVDVIETYYMENPIKRNEIHIVDAKDNNEVQQKIWDYYVGISKDYEVSYVANIQSINKLIQ